MTTCVITGGLGFLGRQVAQKVLQRGTLWCPLARAQKVVTKVTLFDSVEPVANDSGLDNLLSDSRVCIATGDITASGTAHDLVMGEGNISVFHFASMMSGNSEDEFDKAWEVNVLAQRSLIEALRALPTTPRFLFTSSVAILGAEAATAAGEAPHDGCKLLPENTYGFTKAVCELMLNEYTRRGFIDGRGLRLPTVIVRPGKPNAATTGSYSGAVREPLSGMTSQLPLPLALPHPVASFGRCVEAMLTLMDAPHSSLHQDRIYNMPSLTTSLEELIAATKTYATAHGLQLPEPAWENVPDTKLSAIVGGMTSTTDGSRALALGVRGDDSVDQIIADYGLECLGIDA